MNEPIRKTKYIFILEDDPDTREATAQVLIRTKDFKVLTSDSTIDAMFRLKNQKFDCIILDYHIGSHENSEGIIHYIRSKAGFNKDTPIILMTGGILKDVFLKLKSNLNSALIKPVSSLELIARVNKVTAE